MTFRTILNDDAELDLSDAASWYEEQQKGLGKRFLAEVRGVTDRLRANPFSFAFRYQKVRTAPVKVFP